MTQTAINYAKAVYELNIPEQDIYEAEELIRENSELFEVLCSPVIKKTAKHNIINKIFPESVRGFLTVLCDHGTARQLPEIMKCYKAVIAEKNKIMSAELIYVDMPTETQLDGIRKRLMQKYGKETVNIKMTEDKSLIGGFVIRCNDEEIDYSIKGRIGKLGQKLIRR